MERYNPLEKHNDTQVKHAQVIFLHEILKKPISFIADITEYAESTVKGYVKKYKNLLSWAQEIFTKVETTFIAYFSKRKTKYDNRVFVADNVDLLDEAAEKCYLISFYDKNDNLVCSKVGTTTRTVIQRVKEELNSKTYTSRGCEKVKINRVYDCKNIPAEGLESYLRAIYIRDFPEKFNKNDRFFDVEFDFEEADNFVLNYYK